MTDGAIGCLVEKSVIGCGLDHFLSVLKLGQVLQLGMNG